MYGKQDMTMYCNRPAQISIDREDLRVAASSYEASTRLFTLTLQAMDYQGVAANILITW
jgi:hypothetical protein